MNTYKQKTPAELDWLYEREGGRERGRERETETERDRQREREREGGREREREKGGVCKTGIQLCVYVCVCVQKH